MVMHVIIQCELPTFCFHSTRGYDIFWEELENWIGFFFFNNQVSGTAYAHFD